MLTESCVLRYAIIMRDRVISQKEWKRDKYKVNIMRKKGGFGPHYYVCEIYVREKIFYKKIIEHYFSWNADVKDCSLIFIENRYQVHIDTCKDSLSFF